MRIAVGSDEKTPLTDAVVEELARRGAALDLHGALKEGDDPNWPVVAQRVAQRVADGRAEQGVLFCWTGTGVSIVANKVPGVRAALCVDAETAEGARRWNDANLLCLSLRSTPLAQVQDILDAWLGGSPDESERANIERVRSLDRQRIAEAA